MQLNQRLRIDRPLPNPVIPGRGEAEEGGRSGRVKLAGFPLTSIGFF